MTSGHPERGDAYPGASATLTLPMIGRPVIPGAPGDETSLDPDVLVPVPVVIAWGPHEAGARWGNLDRGRRRRCDVDFDAVVSSRRGRTDRGRGHASSEPDRGHDAKERVLQWAASVNQGYSHGFLRQEHVER